MQTVLSPKRLNPALANNYSGILLAISVISLWLISLIILLSINISQLPWFLLILAVLLRAFLHTGLFITTHDAMHGTVFPQHRQLNDFIGSVAARMYVFLPYKILLEKHQLHHQYPASAKDPDFCEDGSKNPLLWYISFMKGYLEGKQSLVVFICMSLVFYPLLLGLHIPLVNLILFWLLPIFLSSIQLFCFGIFLPHRQPKDGYTNRHRAKSSNFSVFLSFLTCYHFGYHWEHHEYPNIPWYKLPAVVNSSSSSL